MLKRNAGVDILQEIGGIDSIEKAMGLFDETMDKSHRERIRTIRSEALLMKIANAIAMCSPEEVYVNTGTEDDRKWIREKAIANAEEKSLPMEGHTIHFDLREEQGRIIDRTYYIANPDEAINSLANKMLREQALEEIRSRMSGIMRGMTMIVGCYLRGPEGSPVSNPALEITSSAYVAHSAEILYRNAFRHMDREVERLGHFYTNVHSQGLNRPEDLPEARVFMDRSHWTTFSFNCTYAGNTLLLKKGNHRFSVGFPLTRPCMKTGGPSSPSTCSSRESRGRGVASPGPQERLPAAAGRPPRPWPGIISSETTWRRCGSQMTVPSAR
jgi:phosphoenolpyruvate carboxykinase (GTP)